MCFRLFQAVQYGTKPEGRLVSLVSTSQAQRSTAAAATTATPATTSTPTAAPQNTQARGKLAVPPTASTQGEPFTLTVCSGKVCTELVRLSSCLFSFQLVCWKWFCVIVRFIICSEAFARCPFLILISPQIFLIVVDKSKLYRADWFKFFVFRSHVCELRYCVTEWHSEQFIGTLGFVSYIQVATVMMMTKSALTMFRFKMSKFSCCLVITPVAISIHNKFFCITCRLCFIKPNLCTFFFSIFCY